MKREPIRVEVSLIETECSSCDRKIHKEDKVLHVEDDETLDLICRKCLIRFLQETR